MYGIIISFQTS